MKKLSGVIYEYTKKNGETQRAVALYSDQKQASSSSGPIFLRLQNSDGTYSTDASNKQLVATKPRNQLKHIGFQD